MYPNRFTTIDQFVIDALQKANSLKDDTLIQKINKNATKKNEALYALDLLQKKSKELNNTFSKHSWSPRNIDKALWAGSHK